MLVPHEHDGHHHDRLSNTRAQASALHELYEHQWRDVDLVSVKHALVALVTLGYAPSDDW
jgi:hypothetical protein